MAYPSPVRDAFENALAQLWARDGIAVDDSGALARDIASSFENGADGTRAASDLLVRSGIRARWNQVLRYERAATLAAKIRPFVDGPLLDVLSGDGSISRALTDLGVGPIAVTERAGDYPASVLPQTIPFEAFTDDLDLSRFNASTALLSTVLHHEPDPVRLLDRLAQARIQRWIVVENCVTPRFSHVFHQYADRFFNGCLNEFGVDCVEQHRTLEEWVALLRTYGIVDVIDESFAVPGIPFPYSLLVVQLRSARSSTSTEHQECRLLD